MNDDNIKQDENQNVPENKESLTDDVIKSISDLLGNSFDDPDDGEEPDIDTDVDIDEIINSLGMSREDIENVEIPEEVFQAEPETPSEPETIAEPEIPEMPEIPAEPEVQEEPAYPEYDEEDIVEADPYEQMTREEAAFMRRKELVGNRVEMYDDTIPYEQGLPPKERKTINFRGELFSWAESITVAVLVVCLLFAFAVRTIGVIGPSMQSTLFEKDRLIVSDIGFTPRYGDIVIISKKSFSKDTIVKRVIATEGQTVDIDFENGYVYVDGEILDEPYINEPTYREWDVQFPVTVPEDCVFVMGDNRNNSTDSRDSDIGMVNEQEILGRVLFRFWPLGEIKVFKRF